MDLKLLLSDLLAMPKETEWVEFKEAKCQFDFDKLGKYFSALCNEANLNQQPFGCLVFGVTNAHEIIGSQYRPDQIGLDRLKSEIANHTTSRVTFTKIEELFYPEGRVILFQIPPAPKGIPIAWKGHYYGRDGESLSALNIQEIEQIRNQTQTYDWSSQICDKADIDDLDSAAILKAKTEYKQKFKSLADDVDAWDDETFLNKAKITNQGRITNAAIVLLGKNESEHFISPAVARITWLLKDGKNVEKDYEHFGPPFILNAEKVFSKIRNLNYRYLPNSQLFPVELTQYEPWVIREALHNCIAHQDYELMGRINLVENPDELILTNVGSFIPGSVEEVIKRNAPPEIYRNHFLAQAMVNLNMIDTIGSGIKKMFELQRKRNFPLPDYDLSDLKRVSVKIQGKILDENYTRLLIEDADLDLGTVIILDKVQKYIKISKGDHRLLKSRKLVEGRYPNLFVSSRIASFTNQKSKYIRYRGLDETFYQNLVVKYLKQYGHASRRDINQLLLEKLPDVLSPQQKANKINRLLSKKMAGEEKIIKNIGPRKSSKWVLVEKEKNNKIA